MVELQQFEIWVELFSYREQISTSGHESSTAGLHSHLKSGQHWPLGGGNYQVKNKKYTCLYVLWVIQQASNNKFIVKNLCNILIGFAV